MYFQSIYTIPTCAKQILQWGDSLDKLNLDSLKYSLFARLSSDAIHQRYYAFNIYIYIYTYIYIYIYIDR